MTRPYRFLSTVDKALTVPAPPEAVTVESDFVVILAAVLCALICIVGLIAVARCAWLRRGSVASWAHSPVQQSTNKGIKKKVIEVLPKFKFNSDKEDNGRGSCGMLNSSDCVICLTEYVNGDEICVLPLCGHGFHVDCIDMWLSSHSSCPSCRQVLVTSRCKTCEFSTDGNDLLEIENKGRQQSSSSISSDYLP